MSLLAKWFTAALALASIQAMFIPTAWARSTDRNQPMDIDAGQQQGSLDDRTPTVLSGGVTIVQGTLNVAADRAVITTTGGDISRAVLTGRPAKLKQQLDDGTPMNAAANQVDYNLRTEVVVFTGNVSIQQPRGSLSGERVVYNMKTGEVNSGGQGSGRVKMRILPRNAPQGGG
ncbi:MAG: lipopolysaccharide transport periplasmic protein LptA [Lysobacter sp.]